MQICSLLSDQVRNLRSYAVMSFGWIIMFFAQLWPQKKSHFIVCGSRKAARLSYNHLGVDRMVYLPFNPRLVSKMSGHRAILIKEGEEIDITQQVGLPYLVTAADLGGTEIRIIQGERERRFGPNEKIDSSVFSLE